MKPILVCLALCLCFCVFASLSPPADAADSWVLQPQSPAVASPDPVASDAEFGAVDRLTIRQRREMGLTIAAISKATKELKASGEITKEMSRSEVAAAVLEKLSADNPRAYANPRADWDSILAFIERLLPLIMMLLGLL